MNTLVNIKKSVAGSLLLTMILLISIAIANPVEVHAGGDPLNVKMVSPGINWEEETVTQNSVILVYMKDLDEAFGGAGSFSTLYFDNKIDAYFEVDNVSVKSYQSYNVDNGGYFAIWVGRFNVGQKIAFFTDSDIDTSNSRNTHPQYLPT